MDIQITGRHVDLGDAFKEHVKDRLEEGASKYFSRALNAHVIVEKDSHLFMAECHFHANQGVNLESSGKGETAYAAFDEAAEKVEKQLRRYKRRLKNHHSRAAERQREFEKAAAYILPADGAAAAEDGTEPQDQPIIIAETKTDIPEVSVGDAVMLMDLAHAPAFMFRNAKNNALNVVYRRPDGNIGWINPAETTGSD
ncbi:MAG: ribosome-associated translation inhibitor RaiA [Pseudomonadota bacterium]